MAVFASILILSSTVHPKHWMERDIVIDSISTVNGGRSSYYQITDANGNAYSINRANDNVSKLVCGETYHIIYADIHWNRIQYMADSAAVYVDYDASMDNYYARTIIGWIGIFAESVTAFIMIRNSFRKIQAIKGKR